MDSFEENDENNMCPNIRIEEVFPGQPKTPEEEEFNNLMRKNPIFRVMDDQFEGKPPEGCIVIIVHPDSPIAVGDDIDLFMALGGKIKMEFLTYEENDLYDLYTTREDGTRKILTSQEFDSWKASL